MFGEMAQSIEKSQFAIFRIYLFNFFSISLPFISWHLCIQTFIDHSTTVDCAEKSNWGLLRCSFIFYFFRVRRRLDGPEVVCWRSKGPPPICYNVPNNKCSRNSAFEIGFQCNNGFPINKYIPEYLFRRKCLVLSGWICLADKVMAS